MTTHYVLLTNELLDGSDHWTQLAQALADELAGRDAAVTIVGSSAHRLSSRRVGLVTLICVPTPPIAFAARRRMDVLTNRATGNYAAANRAKTLRRVDRLMWRILRKLHVTEKEPDTTVWSAPSGPDFEFATTKLLAHLAPDLIHGTDAQTCWVAKRAAGRQQALSYAPVVVDDSTQATAGAVTALVRQYRRLLSQAPALSPDESLNRELWAGRVPELGQLHSVVREILNSADRYLAAGDQLEAARASIKAGSILFHRTLHVDGIDSPLADNPEEFLHDWNASQTSLALRQPSTVAPPRPSLPRTSRVAVLTGNNNSFVSVVSNALETVPGVRVATSPLADLGVRGLPAFDLADPIARRLGQPIDRKSTRWIRSLNSRLADYDTLWIDWCDGAAVLLTSVDIGNRRIVIRLHSYEAFKQFPHVIDWSIVDDLVFVGPHLRDLVVASVPAITSANGPAIHVIPNSIDTANMLRPKTTDARFTLGVLGWSVPAKDVNWAVNLLSRLKDVDSRYRLRLIGDAPSLDGPTGVRHYREAVLDRVNRPDVRDSIEIVGQTADVASALTNIGTIVSSSVREGAPLAVIEGASSGAVPVVRDWPLLAAYDGPRRLFPPSWVVRNLDEAQERVLETTQDEAVWLTAGDAAALTAKQRYDHSALCPDYTALVGDPDRPPRSTPSVSANSKDQ